MADTPRSSNTWGARIPARLKAKKTRGEFFTPPEVVDFMFEMVGAGPGWSVIDPACGDGAFLERAVAAGCAPVWGVDKDATAVNRCRARLGDQAVVIEQDGLLPLTDRRTPHEGFDLVIGNPPFNAVRHGVADPEILSRFILGQRPDGQVRLKQPVEVLFLERFLQLARGGGTVAVIVPDGILANSRLRYVRELVLASSTVMAVVSLPRYTFAKASTSAKTSILFMKKGRPASSDQALLASVEADGHLASVLELIGRQQGRCSTDEPRTQA